MAQGYFLGAFLYLGIVFTLPATLGVASLALDLPVRPGGRAKTLCHLNQEQHTEGGGLQLALDLPASHGHT